MERMRLTLPAGYSTKFEASEGAENDAWWLVGPDGQKTSLSLELSEEGVWYVNHFTLHANGNDYTLRGVRQSLRQTTAVKAFEAEAARMAAEAAAAAAPKVEA